MFPISYLVYSVDYLYVYEGLINQVEVYDTAIEFDNNHPCPQAFPLESGTLQLG